MNQVNKTNVRQVSNKFNYGIVTISIIVLIICGMVNVEGILGAYRSEWYILLVYVIREIIIFSAIITLIFFGIKIYTVKSINKYLKNLPYGFDYTIELYTYKMIGRNKKKMKYGAEYFSKYSGLKSSIEETYKKHKECEDFEKFLVQMKRNKENMVDSLKTIVIPMEIAMVSALYNSYKDATDPNIFFILTVLTTTVLMCYFVRDISNVKDEINFLTDYMDILFINKKKKTDVAS